jgi:hypothetical protein
MTEPIDDRSGLPSEHDSYRYQIDVDEEAPWDESLGDSTAEWPEEDDDE